VSTAKAKVNVTVRSVCPHLMPRITVGAPLIPQIQGRAHVPIAMGWVKPTRMVHPWRRKQKRGFMGAEALIKKSNRALFIDPSPSKKIKAIKIIYSYYKQYSRR